MKAQRQFAVNQADKCVKSILWSLGTLTLTFNCPAAPLPSCSSGVTKFLL